MMRKFSTWLQLLFKDYATYKLFRLEDYGTPALGMESQGMDVYGDFIVQGSDRKGVPSIVVIDMARKRISGEVLFDIAGCHMNNINVGTKQLGWSPLPLVYVSECKGKHRCFVINIKADMSGYDTLQTIEFESKSHYGKSKNAFDWFVAGRYICTFGMTDNTAEIEVIKFPMPDLKRKSVKFTDSDIVSSFTIKDCNVYQGSKVIDGKLYAPFGLGTDDCPTCIKVINLYTGAVERSVEIKGLGEIEAISKYDDGFIVVNSAINPTYTFLKL